MNEKLAEINVTRVVSISEQDGLSRNSLFAGKRRLTLLIGLRLILLVSVFVVWQITADHGWVKKLYVSTPTAIWEALVKDIGNGLLIRDLGTTMYETVLGFAISAVLGVTAGILLYSSALLYAVLRPFISALNSLPRLALAPLLVLWLGLGSASAVALVISLVFFIIMLNTYAGLQAASRDHLILARTLGARKWTLFRTFVLPAAIPTVFAGFQLGLTYAFLGAVIGEMLAGSSGIGARLALTAATFNTSSFFAALVLLMAVATILAAGVRAIERRLLRWQQIELRGVERI